MKKNKITIIKNPPANAGDTALIPGFGRSPGEGNGNPLQYSWASFVEGRLSWWRICLQCRRPGFDPWVRKIPWRRERLPTPVYWSGQFHELYSSWGCKESDMTEWLSHSPSFHLGGTSWTSEDLWMTVEMVSILQVKDLSVGFLNAVSNHKVPYFSSVFILYDSKANVIKGSSG